MMTLTTYFKVIKIDHINYIRDLIGADHVGIGADYDGVSSMPEGLEDVSKYSDLFDRLYVSDANPRWTREDLEKLAGRNLIRVFKAVEAVRDSLKSTPPRDDIIDGLDLFNAQRSLGLKPGACNTAIEWKGLNVSWSDNLE